MRGTSPALAMSEIKYLATSQITYIDSDYDAEKGGVDARNDRGQAFLASSPVPCDRLSVVVPPEAERMFTNLLPHAKSFTILSRRDIFFIERLFRWTGLG